MSDCESHKSCAIEYKRLAKSWNKHNFIACLQQLAALGGLCLVSDMDGSYVKSLGVFLGLLSLFFMGKDYVASRFLDKKVVNTLLEGLNLERKNPRFESFFRDVLRKFSVLKILTTRSISTVLFVSILAHRMNKILFGETASYTEKSRMIIGVIGITVGVGTCILYYQPYDSLEEAKRTT